MRQRSNLFWPVNILLGFIVLMGLMLASAAITPLSVLAVDPFDCPTNGPAVGYPEYPVCSATRVALFTQTALARNPATNTPTTESNTGGNNNNNNTNPAPTNTPTITATATITTTTDADQDDATSTPTFTPTLQPTQTVENDLPSPTPTPLLPIGVETRVCLPGETIEITGEGTPGTPLIVTFADRPVGGGSVRSDGTYRITLRIGTERPGLYLVEVEERDSRFVIQEFGCEVPAPDASPTPVDEND